MQDIQFRKIELGFDVIDFLKENMIIGNRTHALLQVAQNHGGYIAGGFGTLLARQFVIHTLNIENIFSQVRRHLREPRFDGNSDRFRNTGCGDIDVWFSSQSSLDAFIADPTRQDLLNDQGQMRINDTMTLAAIEHVILNDARVQVVTRWLRPLEEQIGSFDIYNGMVAVQKNVITIPEEWEYLENNGLLHVSTWASEWTMNRVFKWLNRKRWYTGVTPSTADQIFQKLTLAHDVLINYRNKALDESTGRMINQDTLTSLVVHRPSKRVQEMLYQIIPTMSAKNLLEMSTLFGTDASYDLSTKELVKRMSVK